MYKFHIYLFIVPIIIPAIKTKKKVFHEALSNIANTKNVIVAMIEANQIQAINAVINSIIASVLSFIYLYFSNSLVTSFIESSVPINLIFSGLISFSLIHSFKTLKKTSGISSNVAYPFEKIKK